MAFEKLTPQQIKQDPRQQLKSFRKTKDFLVAIDTDGCVADNMNGKQMLIFHPQYMEFYNLWGIESYFREVGEYYNLFSTSRGCNRFEAVSMTLKALRGRTDVTSSAADRGAVLPDPAVVDGFIAYCRENNFGLGNPGLEKFLATRPTDFSLYKLLGWSEAVNRTFPFINPRIPPFENVRESLRKMSERADVIVVSQTPYEDLLQYWETQDFLKYIHLIAGQEMGTKTYHIEAVKKAGGYSDDHVLMMGDGGGDLKAVRENKGLFYPVPPGYEQEAWADFDRRFSRFLEGTYAGDFEDGLIAHFKSVLLTVPPWEKPGYDHAKAYREKQAIRKALYEKLDPGGRLLVL